MDRRKQQRREGVDRRRYPRLDSKFILSYRQSSADYDMSRTKNIGYGGISFTAGRQLEVGKVVNLVIKFPFHDDPVKIKGQVVSCKGKGLIYDTSVKFLFMAPTLLDEFKAYQKKMRSRGV
jgi:hypothetical protein